MYIILFWLNNTKKLSFHDIYNSVRWGWWRLRSQSKIMNGVHNCERILKNQSRLASALLKKKLHQRWNIVPAIKAAAESPTLNIPSTDCRPFSQVQVALKILSWLSNLWLSKNQINLISDSTQLNSLINCQLLILSDSFQLNWTWLNSESWVL